MADPPSIDLSCSHCGSSQTYRLAPDLPPDPAASGELHEVPSIDLRCLKCGGANTYRLMPANVHASGSGL
jgi:hypothetical protein